MKIETTLDKVVIDEQELQTLIKDYVRNKTQRIVHGEISFQLRNGSDSDLRCTAWAKLEPHVEGVPLS